MACTTSALRGPGGRCSRRTRIRRPPGCCSCRCRSRSFCASPRSVAEDGCVSAGPGAVEIPGAAVRRGRPVAGGDHRDRGDSHREEQQQEQAGRGGDRPAGASRCSRVPLSLRCTPAGRRGSLWGWRSRACSGWTVAVWVLRPSRPPWVHMPHTWQVRPQVSFPSSSAGLIWAGDGSPVCQRITGPRAGLPMQRKHFSGKIGAGLPCSMIRPSHVPFAVCCTATVPAGSGPKLTGGSFS